MAHKQTQVILVGGFLGAGKTTLLLAAARRLAAQGRRVGLVTNDQGGGLVDSALAAHYQTPVAEVAGGCFCCRFPDLLTAFAQLQAQVQPEVILAEPVGSCTDLAATVLLPLARYYGDRFTVAPLTVLVDGSRETARFSARVAYLYYQQLAEAELLALNKLDLLSPEQQAKAADELRAAYPDAQVLGLAAGSGVGVDEWLAAVMGQESRLGRVLDIDYGLYAEAEAGLAWLNAKAVARAGRPFAADALAARLLQELARRLAAQGAAIAHLKLALLAPGVMLKGSLTEAGRPVYWDEWRPDA
ncbi:MAG TPA: GTP-binding protein, partial [Caldilineaceae bacterium]|nr:GTP-binding protein [Caldilineaceae bacterium]